MQEIAIRKKPHRKMKQFLSDWAVLENLVHWLYEIHEDWK